MIAVSVIALLITVVDRKPMSQPKPAGRRE
jgi:hypothetical protein